MKTAQLRQSILQAAVQGKLVPQNIHDEPADKLLERIRAEKARLVKEGKIRKDKPLPPISEDEVPYDLPDGWVWCRLGEICSFVNGDRSSNYPSGTDIKKSGIPFISSKNIQNYQVNLSASELQFITTEKYASLRSGHLQDKDILFVLRGSVGKFGIFLANEEFSTGFVNAQIVIVRLVYSEQADYILNCLKSDGFSQFRNRASSGSAVAQLSANNLSHIPVPIPPINEQQRIVAKVDELMASCDELEAAEKEMDKLETDFAEYLPKSILQAAVQGKLVPQNIHDEPADKLLERIRAEKAKLVKEGKIKKGKPLPPITEDEKPYDLPEGWIWCRLGEVCDYGSANNADPADISDNAWLLELEDIEKDTGIIKSIVAKKSRESKSTKHIFQKGNVLYSKLRPYLNKVAVAEREGYCTSEILPLDFGEINAYYVQWFMRSPYFVEYANAHSYGVKMPRLGTQDGRAALFPLPPLAEQQRIVARVDGLMALCDELKAAKDISFAFTIPKVIPFPTREDDEVEEIGIAARGDVQGLSDEAMRDIDELFGDEAND